MNTNQRCETSTEAKGNCERYTFLWPAVFVAAIIGTGLNFLFSLLGLAFGVSAFSTSADGMLAFSTGGFVALAILSIIAMFFVGWIAGYIARPFCFKRYYGELYGLTAWSLTLILTILLAGSVGTYLTNSTYIVNRHSTPITFSVTTVKTEHKATPTVVTNTQADADALAMTLFATFSLFFLSALSSCFGGRCAIIFQCKKHCKDNNLPNNQI